MSFACNSEGYTPIVFFFFASTYLIMQLNSFQTFAIRQFTILHKLRFKCKSVSFVEIADIYLPLHSLDAPYL